MRPARNPVTPRAASSVVLLREGETGPELLFLERSPDLRFQGGYWVFPGGRIDATDYSEAAPDDERAAARRAAVREAHEEARVAVPEDDLVFAIHWTTPTTSPIRFATWFFAAETNAETVKVDGQEIHDHRWLRPVDALDRQRGGGMKLAAPTFAITTRLAGFSTVPEALDGIRHWPPERLLGRIHDIPGGRVALYSQDVSYEHGRLDEVGPRHRLWMVEGRWHYEREF